ncbi:MAG: Ig-like domain-containing protein [Acutalibacteraceae bacterium]
MGENFNTVTEISSITLNKKTLTLTIGESYTLTKTLSPSGVRSTFVWSSNNTSVLGVDNSGRITAKAVGTAIIMVKSANGKAATCTVTVKKPEVVTPPEETDKLIGDINDDGAVDINDATYIQMYLAGYENCPIDKSDSAQLKIADFNKDKKIDINDVTAIQMMLAGYNL